MTPIQYQKIMLGMLLADAHCMPLHWNYEPTAIDKIIENKEIDLNMLNTGDVSSYYKGKQKGDLSHHGDMIYHLYEYLHTNEHTFDINNYISTWKIFISSYKWYKDASTKSTLEHISFDISPTGADSSDFCGVSMGIPLLIQTLDNVQKAEELVISRTTMTHNNTLTTDTVRWLVRVLFSISSSHDILLSLDKAAESIDNEIFQKIYEKGKLLTNRQESIHDLIAEVGLGCGIEVGLPILIVLIHRHHSNYYDFIKENTYAGADATSRALVGGAILGAIEHATLPTELLEQLSITII